MKKISMTFILSSIHAVTFLLLIPCITVSQIKTRPVSASPQKVSASKYDSTSNFQFGNVDNYLGQRLYFNGNKEIAELGYAGLYKEIIDGGNIARMRIMINTYKPSAYSISKGWGGLSSHEELAGRYFKVDSVIKSTNEHPIDPYFLKLIEEQSGDTIYFGLDTKYEHKFPFIIVGYFEKIKQQYLGEKYVLRLRDIPIDEKTGESLASHNYTDIWVCSDVVINENDFQINLVLKNKNEEILADPRSVKSFYTEDRAKKYLSRFGAKNWERILWGSVWIGMTKEMCELSRGTPEKINKTTTSYGVHEQWVYDDKYIYFDNDKLTAIQ